MDSKMISLAIGPIVVWLGVFGYVWWVDRRLAKLEGTKEQDDL